MNEWKEVKLGDEIEVTDYVANGSFAKLKQNVKYSNVESYAVLLRLVDFHNKWKGNFIYVDKNSYEFLKKTKVYPNDVIISNVGVNVGTVFKAPNLNKPMTLGPNSILLKCSNNITKKYIYYYFLSPVGQNKISSIVTGSAQPKFNKTDFRNIKIKLPPLPIQKKIADILSVIDEKIETLQNINETLEEMAKAIFKSWFVDFDIVKVKANGKSDSEIAKEFGISEEVVKLFPSEFEISEIGKIPKGWEVVYLKDEFKFERGVEPGSKWYIENPTKSEIQKKHLVPFYRVKDLDITANIYIPIEVSKNKISKFGDVLVSFDGTIGRVNAFLEGAYSSGIRKINATNYSNAFIYFLMKSDYIQDLIRKYATGTTILHAGKSINYLYLIKSDKIVKEYEKIIIPIFKTILSNTQQIQTLQELRDTLLPKLINGEIEVDELDIKGFE